MKKNEILVSISMESFGINCSVLTEDETVQAYCREYSKIPDSKWYGGRGKKFLHKILKQRLQVEDAYFDTHIHEAITTNDRWNNFMKDCVMLAALDHVITARPIKLIHPSIYGRNQHPDMPLPNCGPSTTEGLKYLIN